MSGPTYALPAHEVVAGDVIHYVDEEEGEVRTVKAVGTGTEIPGGMVIPCDRANVCSEADARMLVSRPRPPVDQDAPDA